MSTRPDKPPAAIRQVLRLAAGTQALLVPIDAVREILEVGRLTQVPQAPALLRGVMNLTPCARTCPSPRTSTRCARA
jgi:chemotaxis signal transduction protein